MMDEKAKRIIVHYDHDNKLFLVTIFNKDGNEIRLAVEGSVGSIGRENILTWITNRVAEFGVSLPSSTPWYMKFDEGE